MDCKPRIIILCSGSVATLKVPQIFVELAGIAHLRIICSSDAALHFLVRSETYNPTSWNRFIEAGGLDSFISDEDEWDSWEKIGDSVLHIELRNIADMLLVCPASADVLAKISNGISDSFFLSILRAWDFNKPCLIAPAMNTLMWRHDITSRHVRYLQSLGCKFIDPVCKKLACEDVGVGALADVTTIVKAVKDYLPASDTEFPTSKIFPIYKSFGNKLSRMKREKMIISRYRVDSFMYGIVVGVVIAGIGGYISSFAKKTVLN